MATIAVAACNSEETSPAQTDAGPPAATPITWYQDVAPIIHDKCVGCHHSDGGIAPFALETFEQAGPIAGFMLEKVEAGEMPPWSARDAADCAPEHNWKDDARLSDEQLATLQTWVSDGALEGDSATCLLYTSDAADED